MSFFIKGTLVGFSIAAPVGPIGILCIRRSLVEGQLIGLATGLGAATADAAYGAVAGFGLTTVSSFLLNQKLWLGLIGGAFLCFLGVRTFISQPAQKAMEGGPMSLTPAYLSTLVLTLANPTTILSFLAVFAGMGLVAASNYNKTGYFVAGVFTGSALWWIILSSAVGFFRSRLNEAWMKTANRLSGCLIFSFGIYSFLIL